MSEDLIIAPNATKQEKYEALLPQLQALLESETDIIANMANLTAALNQAFGWLWTGFYIVRNEELVLGPFQGPIACTRIKYGRGVCGTAWKKNQSLLVPDVNLFPGHIACSSLSVSEIVIPICDNTGKVIAVLDVDSQHYGVLDETDVRFLQEIALLIK